MNDIDSVVAEALSAPYSRVLVREDDGAYSARVIEFRGCYSQGDTPDEAMNSLDEAMRGWIRATLDAGRTIPEPLGHQEHSGRLVLRLPKSLHAQVAGRAEADGASLNQTLVAAVAQYVGIRNLATEIAESVARSLRASIQVSTLTQLTFGASQGTSQAPQDFTAPEAGWTEGKRDVWLRALPHDLGPVSPFDVGFLEFVKASKEEDHA